MDLPYLLASIGRDCSPKSPVADYINDAESPVILAGFDLSYNALVGEIPSSLGLCNKDVTTIRLDNNALVGHIPVELGGVANLEILTLSNNHLAGTIPASIIGNTSLVLLDLSHNELEGNLNTLFSLFPNNITYVSVVLLSHNRINGSIPSPFRAFMPNLQVIDFSNNRLTGTIPQKLQLTSLQSLRQAKYPDSSVVDQSNLLNHDIQLVVKGIQLSYSKVLETMKSSDLSCNFLEGEIPAEMGDLAGLVYLNLSHNNLSGSIPRALANLTLLEALDVSSNRLAGPLPSDDLSNLTKLAIFNITFNASLSGSIPQGPQFEVSESYKGEPHLCGSPALQDCKPSTTLVAPHTSAQPSPPRSAIAQWIDEWIALPGLSLGIVVGFATTLFLRHYKHWITSTWSP